MAIFGRLEDMPVPDVLGMLGSRRGSLEIHSADRRADFQILLGHGRILQIRRDDDWLDPLRARGELRGLLALQAGDFEFTADFAAPPPTPPLDWPVERVLLSMVINEDERKALASVLPHPMIRFEPTANDAVLHEPLKSFWQAARPRMIDGASAQDLTQGLGLPLSHVRYYLYQLRVAECIAPKRAFRVEQPTEERKSVVGRLLGALFRRDGSASARSSP